MLSILQIAAPLPGSSATTQLGLIFCAIWSDHLCLCWHSSFLTYPRHIPDSFIVQDGSEAKNHWETIGFTTKNKLCLLRHCESILVGTSKALCFPLASWLHPAMMPLKKKQKVENPTSEASGSDEQQKQQGQVNIVELANSVADLSTWVANVVAGDLVKRLSSSGPFTVFAPTNEAFGEFLPKPENNGTLDPENKDQLVDILTSHVIPGQVLSTDLQPSQTVWTIGRPAPLLVTVDNGEVHVNKAKVVSADNLASNGVVHIIDGLAWCQQLRHCQQCQQTTVSLPNCFILHQCCGCNKLFCHRLPPAPTPSPTPLAPTPAGQHHYGNPPCLPDELEGYGDGCLVSHESTCDRQPLDPGVLVQPLDPRVAEHLAQLPQLAEDDGWVEDDGGHSSGAGLTPSEEGDA